MEGGPLSAGMPCPSTPPASSACLQRFFSVRMTGRGAMRPTLLPSPVGMHTRRVRRTWLATLRTGPVVPDVGVIVH